MYSFPGLPWPNVLPRQVSAIVFIVRKWVWDSDTPGVLVVDVMGLCKTFTLVVVTMICKLQTEKVVIGLQQLILWRNTLAEWVRMEQNDNPRIICEEWEWYPWQRPHSVPHCHFQTQPTPPQGHPALTAARESILVIPMPGLTMTFNHVISKMTNWIHFKLVNFFHTENWNVTHEDLKFRIGKLENRWNIQLVLNHSQLSSGKPSSNGQLSYCSWRFAIFDESHLYKTTDSLGWQIAMKGRIGFEPWVTAMLGCHWVSDWGYRTMWLCSGAPGDPEDDTGIEKHDAEVLHSAVRSVMHAIQTEDEQTPHDMAHYRFPNAKLWTIRRCSESKLPNEQPLVWIWNEHAHNLDLEYTEKEHSKLNTDLEKYALEYAPEVWRARRWYEACVFIMLADSEDDHNKLGQCYDNWRLDALADSLTCIWLRETFLAMLVNKPVEYPQPDHDCAPREALLPKHERKENPLLIAPPPDEVVRYCSLPDQIHHLQSLLTRTCADHVHTFQRYVEIGNDHFSAI